MGSGGVEQRTWITKSESRKSLDGNRGTKQEQCAQSRAALTRWSFDLLLQFHCFPRHRWMCTTSSMLAQTQDKTRQTFIPRTLRMQSNGQNCGKQGNMAQRGQVCVYNHVYDGLGLLIFELRLWRIGLDWTGGG